MAESITAINEFKLQYKRDDVVEWSGEIRVVPRDNGDNYYAGKYDFDGLQPATRYVARIASQNDYGYNDYSEAFLFATKGAGKLS